MYRVITTLDRVMTEGELRALGIPLPNQGPSVPWQEEKREAIPERATVRAVPASPVGLFITAWREKFRGDNPDPRLPKQLPQWLDEHGMDRLMRALDIVAAQKADPMPRYERFKKALKQLRDAAGGSR